MPGAIGTQDGALSAQTWGNLVPRPGHWGVAARGCGAAAAIPALRAHKRFVFCCGAIYLLPNSLLPRGFHDSAVQAAALPLCAAPSFPAGPASLPSGGILTFSFHRFVAEPHHRCLCSEARAMQRPGVMPYPYMQPPGENAKLPYSRL